MKVKLRNLTNEQYKKWGREGCHSSIDCENCIFNNVYCGTGIDKRSWINHKDLYSDKFLDQEINVGPILDAKEKEYLETVLKPFKENVKKIRKLNIGELEEIIIVLRGVIFDNEALALPWFKKGTMYKGMEEGREYFLQELGLFEDGE